MLKSNNKCNYLEMARLKQKKSMDKLTDEQLEDVIKHQKIIIDFKKRKKS